LGRSAAQGQHHCRLKGQPSATRQSCTPWLLAANSPPLQGGPVVFGAGGDDQSGRRLGRHAATKPLTQRRQRGARLVGLSAAAGGVAAGTRGQGVDRGLPQRDSRPCYARVAMRNCQPPWGPPSAAHRSTLATHQHELVRALHVAGLLHAGAAVHRETLAGVEQKLQGLRIAAFQTGGGGFRGAARGGEGRLWAKGLRGIA
jgi:hypothetical protein